MESKKLRAFGTFRLSLNDDKLRDADKFSSLVSWTAAHYHLAPGQTRELATTGSLRLDADNILSIRGRK